MNTDTIVRKWRAGAELVQKINSEFVTGRATRAALEVERRLARCRQCDQFRGNDCAELALVESGPGFHQLLTRAELHCPRWSVAHEMPAGVALSEDPLDRLHRLGTRRTQEERRAARRRRRVG